MESIYQIPKMLKDWRPYLQTIGVAISDREVFNFADKVAKIGVSNLRVVGTVTLPRLGESWDGYYPVLEFMLDGDWVHWVSLNAESVEREIERLKAKLEDLRNGDLLALG